MPPPHRPSTQTKREAERHPSWRGGNPYSQDFRTLVLGISQLGPLDPQVAEFIAELRLNNIFPSISTQHRWEHQQTHQGNILAYRRTGNSFASRLHGQDLILLALYRVTYPRASHAEINAFLYNQNFGNTSFRFYSHSQISEAEARIGLTQKRSSTTAYRALLAVNLMKRWVYWTQPYPMGIAGVRREFIIDLDECGIFLKTANRLRGKAYTGVRVSDLGHYEKGEVKWTLLLGICGEDGNVANQSKRRANVWSDGGTTIVRMYNFVQEVLNDIGRAGPNNFYVFTMDNLSAHKNVAVRALIRAYGHGVVYRAPYWAVDGAIEFVFNSIQSLLRMKLHKMSNDNELVAGIYQSIQSINDFGAYFRNVGFN